MDVSREEGMCSSERDKGTDETPILVTPGGGIRGPTGRGSLGLAPPFVWGMSWGRSLGPGVDVHGEARRDRDRGSRGPCCQRG